MGSLKLSTGQKMCWIILILLASFYLLTEITYLLPEIPGIFRAILDPITGVSRDAFHNSDGFITIGRWRRELSLVFQQCEDVIVEGVSLVTSFSCL